MRTGLLVLAWFSGSVAIGLLVAWRWTRTGLARKYPGEDRCGCEFARSAERILGDGQLCVYPVDGEDGLCGMCRFYCVPLLRELREEIDLPLPKRVRPG
jgi:hypothetical protein